MSVVQMPGVGGLRRLLLSHPSGSVAEVYLNGAHVTSWIPAGGYDWLFVSRSAVFREGDTIRGGIPVVFPQFADRGDLPKHGFARSTAWQWVSEHAADDCSAVLALTDSPDTRQVWPHRFSARLLVELGSTELQVTLEVENTDSTPFSFTSALHSYFRVSDVQRSGVAGLHGATYLDKPAGMAERTQQEPVLRIGGEVDRVYRHAPGQVTLIDEDAGRSLDIATDGFDDVVVWNPWQQLTAEFTDMAPAEYLYMLCVEAAQAVEPVELAPGARWRGTQRLRQV